MRTMRTRKWRRRALAVLLAPVLATTFLSLVPAPANAADDCGVTGNIVTNCGFETGDFTGWTQGGETLNTDVLAYSPHTGIYALRAGPTHEGTLTQTLATASGQVYDLGIWLGLDGSGTGAGDYVIVEVDPDGSGPAGYGSPPLVTVNGPASATYAQSTATFTAGGSEAFLRLRFYNLPAWWMIDDISVVAQVPDYQTSVTDVADPEAYACPATNSTMIGFEDRTQGDELNGVEIDGVTFGVWLVWTEQFSFVADGTLYASSMNGTNGGRLDFASPVSDVSVLATLNQSPVSLEAYSATDTLLATAGPAAPTWPDPMMRELRVTSQSADIAYVVVHDTGNQFAIDDVCYSPSLSDIGTSTGLASNHNPSVFGQSVTLTATVTPDSGSDVPTGTVEFWEGATKLGDDTLNGSGEATLTVSDFSVGSHIVIAKYVPDAGFTASESDPFEQVVNKADTTTVINSVTPSSPTYGELVSFDTTVAPVAPGDGTPTGAVSYKVNKFAGTPDATGYVDFDPATDLLPAGTHHVEAYYAGDGNFNGSQSNAFVVTVDQAETTVAYLGDYLAITGNDFLLKADVDSSAAGCLVGREVTFTLDDGVHTPIVLDATSGAGGAVSKLVSNVSWPTGQYDVLVEVAESDNCTAADNAAAADVITVASPGDAATGGGWYFWKDSGAAKRVNFGFTVSKEADNSYKGSLLLVNQGAWRLKGNLDSFTKDGSAGQAGGTGTLYQWVCSNPSDPLTCSWQNPQAVSFKIMFTDYAAGKAKGKKSAVVDQFALRQISVRNSTLPISDLKDLKGGNIVLR